MTNGKKSGGGRTAQNSLKKRIKMKFSRLMRNYGTQKNVYKAAGIASAIGVAGFLAFRFIPWEKVVDKFEKNFNEVFGEFEFNPSEAEGSI